MRQKLTDRLAQSLNRRRGQPQTDVSDLLMPGLLLRIGERTKTWVIRARLGGRKRRWTLGQFPALGVDAARAKAREYLLAISEGRDPDMAPEGLLEWPALLDAFERDALPKMKEKTRKLWGGLMAAEVRPGLPALDFSDVRGSRALIRAHAEGIAKRAPVLANRFHGLVRRIIRWGVERDMVAPGAAAIVANLIKPTKEQSRERVYTEDELGRIVGAVRREPLAYRLYWWLILLTLQRRDEVLSMRRDAIDWNTATWRLRTKGDKGQAVPLSSKANDLAWCANGLSESDWIIEGDGSDGRVGNVQKSADRIRERTGIEDFRSHDIRRTGATWLAENGTDPAVIARILNHGGIPGAPEVTRVYVRASRAQDVTAALDAWGAHVWSLRRGDLKPD